MLIKTPKQSYQSEHLCYGVCIFIQIMQRKNSEKRFHTAGARIVNSTKLPHDFFRPTKSLEKGRPFHRHPSQPHRPPPHTKICTTGDPLLVTFNRSASLNRLDQPLRYSCTEGKRPDWVNAASKGSTKLPRLSIEKQNNIFREYREVKLVKIRNKKMPASGWTAPAERQMLKL